MGVTTRPGKDSFTRALICALEALVVETSDSRYTMVRLLKIKGAPHFRNDQNPVISDCKKKLSASRPVLHLFQGERSDDELSWKEAASLDLVRKRHTLTLRFDFSNKLSPI